MTSPLARIPAALVGIVLAAGLAACGNNASTVEVSSGSADNAAPAGTPSDQPAAATKATPAIYDFTGKTVDGASFSGASLVGKPAVLWFWAPWCSTCRAQAPHVSDLAEKYADEVNVIGVGGLDKDTAAIRDFAGRTSGVTNLSDPGGSVWRHFKITAQSTYVVLDARGKVVGDGALSDDELKSLVGRLAG